MHAARDHRVGVVGDEGIADAEPHAQPQALARLAGYRCLEADLPALQVRRPAERANPGGRARARSRPSARFRSCADTRSNAARSCQSCLPRGFARSDGSSYGADHDALQRPVVEQIGDVERERRVAALVLAAGRAVDPDGRAVIDGPEVQQDAASVGRPQEREVAAIPAGLDRTPGRPRRLPVSPAQTAR